MPYSPTDLGAQSRSVEEWRFVDALRVRERPNVGSIMGCLPQGPLR
jgi:hypothetical protein